MMNYCRRPTLVAIVSTFLISAVVALHSDDARHTFDRKDWPLVHDDLTNERYSTLNKINTPILSPNRKSRCNQSGMSGLSHDAGYKYDYECKSREKIV